jgi:hypothetical protein
MWECADQLDDCVDDEPLECERADALLRARQQLGWAGPLDLSTEEVALFSETLDGTLSTEEELQNRLNPAPVAGQRNHPEPEESSAGPQPLVRSSRRVKSKSDDRKTAIRELKAKNPNASQLEICRLMDKKIERATRLQAQRLGPLPTWVERFGKTTWEANFLDKKTTGQQKTAGQRVRQFITSCKI